MDDPFDSLIAFKAMGVLYFDWDFKVVACNKTASRMLAHVNPTRPKADLQDLSPEQAGIEEQLTRIIDKTDGCCRLECVNRHDRHGTVCCWDLALLACPQEGRAIVALEKDAVAVYPSFIPAG